jgi:hypothetical protein
LFPICDPGWADNLNHGVRLLEKLMNVAEVVQLGDYRPTDAAEGAFQDLAARIAVQTAHFEALVDAIYLR